MDAEALRGKQLGTCTLQDVIGLGTMGAVYLAVQSQPSRRVAVKVFLRAASLELLHQIEFLESFHKKIAPVSSLDHPHIVSIYSYGDVDGLAYLVMPYIAGETLEDVLVREGALPLLKAASYLEQIAAALDYAHARGVIHRDLKPANIMVRPDGILLLADFHLTAMLTEGRSAPMRLSRPGMLDYMAPEQVLGKELDGRADLYSLGAILYRMVTGTPPFSGQTLMKVATKHLKMPPPSPHASRSDLPPAAEQAMLAALAKTPAERYAYAQDLALTFRQALYGTLSPALEPPPQAHLRKGGVGVVEEPLRSPPFQTQSPSQETLPRRHDATGARLFSPRGLFDPKWRTGNLTAVDGEQHGDASTDAISLRDGFPGSSLPVPSVSTDAYAMLGNEALPTTGTFQPASARVNNPVTPVDQTIPLPQAEEARELRGLKRARLSSEGPSPLQTPLSVPTAGYKESEPQGSRESGVVSRNTQLFSSQQENTGVTGTFKLTGPAKIISIPIAGQPGQYRTGILPTLPSIQESLPAPAKYPLLHSLRAFAFVLAALLVVIGSVTFLLTHTLSNRSTRQTTRTTVVITPDLASTATARAMATLDANTILYDPLTQNIRNWSVASSGTVLYQFMDGAYHITNNDSSRVASAILQGETLTQPYAYSLTMEEIRGDDNSISNQFGMILRFSSQQKNGQQLVSFYTLEVLNKKGGEYQFWKYDNSQGTTVNPWKELAYRAFGSEFHQGQGPNSLNTFKILVNSNNYTLIVNGKQVWTVQDGSLAGGEVGMLVNLKGTEVAFSDLRLTYS